jgi:hypothetical protein
MLVLATSFLPKIDTSLWDGFLPSPGSPTQSLLWTIVSLVLLVSLPMHVRNVRRRRALRAADHATTP